MSYVHRSRDCDKEGGWGWIIVTGSFLNHFLFEGVVRSYGLIYLELLDRFHGSAATTAWIQATFNAVAMTTGPLTGAMVEKFSCRIIVVIGGVLLCMSLLASAYAPNLYFLYFSYSFVGGIAGGFVYSPMVVIVSQYFDKKRGKAMGLAALGGALGTAAMPPLIGYLLYYYGYTGCLVFIAGIVLHHSISGMLYRPITTPRVTIETEVVCGQSLIGSTEYLERCSLRAYLNQDQRLVKNRLYASSLLLRQHNVDVEPVSYSSLRVLSPEKELFALNIASTKDMNDHKVSAIYTDQVLLTNGNNFSSSRCSTNEKKNKAKNSNVVLKTPVKHSQSADAKVNSVHRVKKMFSISQDKLDLMRNVSFLLFCFNLFNIPTTIISTFIFLPGLATEYGIVGSKGAILISVIGVSSAVGRFSFGFIFDLPPVREHRRLFHSCLGVLLGVSTASVAMCGNFTEMAIVCACIGLSEGGVMAQRATALSQYVKPHQLTFAFGIMTMFQGFGNLLGPLLQGYLKDKLRTYSICFYYGGGMTMLSSISLIVDYLIRSRVKAQTDTNPDVVEDRDL